MTQDISRRDILLVAATATAAATVIGTTLNPAPVEAAETISVAKYVLRRLAQNNVATMFGVPGATWEGLFSAFGGSNVSLVINTSDLEAGYAADGYARMRGLGAVAVTRGVGMLGMVSAIAGAYAERSPVVVINGGPNGRDIAGQNTLGVLYSHSIGREKTDLNIFREVTAYAARADTKEQVAPIVDKAITVALTSKRPVYIEINNAIWDETIAAPTTVLSSATPPSGHETQLAAQILGLLKGATKPAILLGCEVQRYGLHDEAVALVGKLGIPYATTLLAKSAVPEQTPGFAGVYDAAYESSHAKSLVENANSLLVVGAVLSIGYRNLVQNAMSKIIRIGDGTARIGTGTPAPIDLRTLLNAMRQPAWNITPELASYAKQIVPTGLSFDDRRKPKPSVPSHPAGSDLTYDEVMKSVSDFIDPSFVLITDTSLSSHPAADVNIAGRNGFVANAVWQSIGYSVGAAIGVGLAQTARRPLVVCGDGGFQMNAQSLSTIARQKIKAIVIVLDNALYAIEQQLVDDSYFSNPAAHPNPYLALNRWNYNDLAKAMGFQLVTTVTDPASLVTALSGARTATGPAFITATMNPKNLPAGLA